MATTLPDGFSESPSLLPLFGRQWRVQKHSRADREELERYARDRSVQPLKRLRQSLEEMAGLLSPEGLAEVVKERLPAAQAEELRWPPVFGSIEFRELFAQPQHAPFLLWVAVRRHQPETTLEEVQALLDQAEDAGEGSDHELELLNVTRRFLLGAEKPLSKQDLEERRAERGRAEEQLLGKVLAAAGASGAEDLAAAILGIAGQGSAISTGGPLPFGSPNGSAGPRTSSEA